MAKKLLGILLILEAVLILYGLISKGMLFADYGTAAATYGNFVGNLIPIVVNVLAGIYLCLFDNVYKMNYRDGFVTRQKQCTQMLAFTLIYVVLLFCVDMGQGMIRVGNRFLTYIVGALPYLIPVAIFAGMSAMYASCYYACKKHCKLKRKVVKELLAEDVDFASYGRSKLVLASEQALFLPKLFCLIPFEQIDSVSFKSSFVENNVFIHLINGKKIEIVAGKNTYKNILAAVNEHQPQQPEEDIYV